MTFDPHSVSPGGKMPPPQDDLGAFDIPNEIAVLPIRDIVVFPLMISSLVIDDEHAKSLVEEVMRTDRMLVVFHPKVGENRNGQASKKPGGPKEQLYQVGTLCSILRMLHIPDGSIRLLLHGVSRVKLDKVQSVHPHVRASIKSVEEIEPKENDLEIEAMMKLTLDNLQVAINMSALSEELLVAALNVDGPGRMADLVASNLPIKPDDLLPVLGERNVKKRLRRVQNLLGREVHMLEIGNRINDEVREEVDRNQRSFFLHQQMKAIRKELGEADPHEAELQELAQRIDEMKMPEHARAVVKKEFGRLQGMPTAAAEYGVIRTYIEWILDIPWEKGTDDHIDIQNAQLILDEDHYGLEKIKERILEYLSVIRLKGGGLKGPILCFVGPPGVGKTSLGRSIARATGRKFQNFSLGGMRDEAEIRGHRRTYVGAMPGRIVKALKDAGTNNPLIMLDEVDKLGSDFRGDPSSALLEVLDPEQNYHFTDHYMDMPIDLSRVMFITTANTLDSIPDPLRDRMEIIRLAGYMDMEKEQIALRYLIPREIENAGIKKKQIQITRPALRLIISDYTAEAGVRALQREIAKLTRKVARQVAEHDSDWERQNGQRKTNKKKAIKRPELDKVKITPDNLEEFLGPKRTFQEVAERMGRPGVAIGLAWTSVGGAIMFIESARFPGDGKLRLTGQLGDVMKESAEAALTYLRSNYLDLGLDIEDFKKYDYHVHVPAGATPKDGPSAGSAIAVSLYSLLTGRPVRDFVAMTGEITLRGNVMPVGGIKEKCLAAQRANIKEVFLPRHNEGDYSEIPDQVKKGLKVTFLDNIGDYVHAAVK